MQLNITKSMIIVLCLLLAMTFIVNQAYSFNFWSKKKEKEEPKKATVSINLIVDGEEGYTRSLNAVPDFAIEGSGYEKRKSGSGTYKPSATFYDVPYGTYDIKVFVKNAFGGVIKAGSFEKQQIKKQSVTIKIKAHLFFDKITFFTIEE